MEKWLLTKIHFALTLDDVTADIKKTYNIPLFNIKPPGGP